MLLSYNIHVLATPKGEYTRVVIPSTCWGRCDRSMRTYVVLWQRSDAPEMPAPEGTRSPSHVMSDTWMWCGGGTCEWRATEEASKHIPCERAGRGAMQRVFSLKTSPDLASR